ncbi:MAG: hypothetical protein IJ493_07520 [Clostridia bacterium]|nr:hypothetical protein [Clostridia bacterium]
MKKYRLLLSAVLLVTTLLSAACGEDAEPLPDAEGVVPLTFVPEDASLTLIPSSISGEVMSQLEYEGTMLLIYKDVDGGIRAACVRGEGEDEVSYDFLTLSDNADSIPRVDGIEPFTDILGQDGFTVTWGWTHIFCNYYIMEDGLPVLLCESGNQIITADPDGDGVIELVSQWFGLVVLTDVIDGQVMQVNISEAVTDWGAWTFFDEESARFRLDAWYGNVIPPRYADYRNGSLYISPYSDEEVRACAAACDFTITEEAPAALYYREGGLPVIVTNNGTQVNIYAIDPEEKQVIMSCGMNADSFAHTLGLDETPTGATSYTVEWSEKMPAFLLTLDDGKTSWRMKATPYYQGNTLYMNTEACP